MLPKNPRNTPFRFAPPQLSGVAAVEEAMPRLPQVVPVAVSIRKRERIVGEPAEPRRLNAPVQNLKIEYVTADQIKPAKTQSREHPGKQGAALRGSMKSFGVNGCIYLDRDGFIIDGHAIFQAMCDLGCRVFPVIRLDLAGDQADLYRIAANKITEMARWNEPVFKAQLFNLKPAILKLQIEPEAFGVSTAQFDALTSPSNVEAPARDGPIDVPATAVTMLGDNWECGDHRVRCDNALIAQSYAPLRQGELARMAFVDAPYGVPIDGHVSGLGKFKHREFVMGAGEMSRQQFAIFIQAYLECLQKVLMNGAIGFHCMDFRSIAILINAGEKVYGPIKQLIVWNKTNAGMGSFYRNKHELIAVFKNGEAPHVNNFGLGETGRYRVNVWDYAGANAFGKTRDADLADHPTVKPTAMVIDAIKDVSKPGEIIIDCFAGSGTTMLAAEQTNRKARLMELDPIYVDVAIKRWQGLTGKKAVLVNDGRSFDEVAVERQAVGGEHRG